MPIMGWLRNQDNSIEFSQYHKWFLSHSKIYTLVNNDHPECLNVNFTGSKTGLEITKNIWSCTISCDYFYAQKNRTKNYFLSKDSSYRLILFSS